jgi:hypothetical protein
MAMRYNWLLLSTGAAGVLSGILWLIPNGLMGGVLAMSLSAGTIWLGVLQTRQKGQLTLNQVLAVGSASGLLGGILMAVISVALADARHGDFRPPQLPFWVPLIMGVLYGLAIHWTYYRRRFPPRSRLRTVLRVCSICFLLKALGTLIYICMTESEVPFAQIPELLLASILFSLFSAIPFALSWTLITVWLDPAWTSPEWECDTSTETVGTLYP